MSYFSGEKIGCRSVGIGGRDVFELSPADQIRQRASLPERGGKASLRARQVCPATSALYLGEINDSQHESWCRTIEVFDEKRERTLPPALFPQSKTKICREFPASS